MGVWCGGIWYSSTMVWLKIPCYIIYKYFFFGFKRNKLYGVWVSRYLTFGDR